MQWSLFDWQEDAWSLANQCRRRCHVLSRWLKPSQCAISSRSNRQSTMKLTPPTL